jgi:hypothetical protein
MLNVRFHQFAREAISGRAAKAGGSGMLERVPGAARWRQAGLQRAVLESAGATDLPETGRIAR